MKKCLSVVLALVLCLSMLSVVAFAEDTYVVAGTAGLCGSEWNGSDTANAMTLNGAVYEKVYDNVPAGDYQFKVVKNGSDWIGNGGINDAGTNFLFTVTAPCKVTITCNPADNSVTFTGDNVGKTSFKCNAVYAVGAGSGAWLNGESWNPAAESNKMAESNGVYSITYAKLPAGEYEFKFAADGAWAHSWGAGSTEELGKYVDVSYNGGNMKFTLAEEADVTLYLDLSKFSLDAGGAKMAIALNGATPEGGDSTEQPTEKPTEGQKPTEKPTEAPTTVPSGDPNKEYTLKIKVPADWAKVNIYTWDSSNAPLNGQWPGAAVQKAGDWYSAKIKGNTAYLIVNDGDKKQTVDLKMPTAKDVWVVVGTEKDGEKFKATVTDKAPSGSTTPTTGGSIDNIKVDGTPSEYCVVGSAEFMGNWDVKSEKGRMNQVEPGVYRVKFKNVPKGEYQMKVVKNKSWDTCWGDNGGNFTFNVAQTGDIVVTFTLKNNVGLITVQGTNVVGTADIPMIGFVTLMVLAATAAVVLVVNRKKFI